jgi:hypothetical protein
VIVDVVSFVDQRRFEPVAANKDEPQLFVTLTSGAEGTANGAAVTDDGVLVHPPTVCVTVYAPGDVTVIVAVVAPVDQRRFDPVAVKIEDPQLSVAETTGDAGNAIGAAIPDPAELVHPLTVCVTVYVPEDVTVIDAVVAPFDHRCPDPEAVKTELPQLLVTVTTGVAGGVPGAAFNVAGKLVHPPTV